MTNVNQAPLPRLSKRRWYVLRLLSGAISSTWLYLFLLLIECSWFFEHPLCDSFKTPKLDAAVVSLKVVIRAGIFFAVFLSFLRSCDIDLWPFDLEIVDNHQQWGISTPNLNFRWPFGSLVTQATVWQTDGQTDTRSAMHNAMWLLVERLS